MRFGGHETFFLRPGWATKGLLLARDAHDLSWNSDEASDAMGVGRNMSKSIGWWLGRMGLIHRPARGEAIAITPFGRAVLDEDRFLARTATIWLLHLHLTLRGEDDIVAALCSKSTKRRQGGMVSSDLPA